VSIIGGFLIIYFSSLSALTVGRDPFPFISLTHAVLPFVTSLTGAILFLLARLVHDEEAKPLYRINIVIQALFILLSAIGLGFAANKHRFAHMHPIDFLIHDGRIQHDNFMAQASSSKTLADAVLEYRRRYEQHPPP
jgi:hypothetical protein